MTIVRFCALLALTLALASCLQRPVRREFVGCPPPPPLPACSPVRIDRIDVDTASANVFAPSTHWKISAVRGASSREDEFALLQGTSVDILLWGENMARDHYATVERVLVDSVALRPQASVPHRMWSAVLPSAIMGDASLAMTSVTNTTLTVDAVLPAPLSLPIVWDAHPVLSHDGAVMVFASDREGGYGGTDLWYAVRTPNGWSVPQNMGPMVNTPCDEISPFIVHGDSVMLFSSAGWSTVGGYDLFRVPLRLRAGAAEVLDSATNIGAPINTRYDEMFPMIPDDGPPDWPIYYASNQRRTFDIWVAHRVPGRHPAGTPPPAPSVPAIAATPAVVPVLSPTTAAAPDTTPLVTVEGSVVSEREQAPVSGAVVIAHPVDDSTTVTRASTNERGEYRMRLPAGTRVEITAQTSQSFFDTRIVDVPASPDKPLVLPPLTIPLTFYLRVNFPTAIFDAPYPYSLDSNGVETQTTWQSDIDLIAANVKMSGAGLKRLVLIGHTDDIGTDASNKTLGQQRVSWVMEQLRARGIDPALMEGRSAGESLLPAKRPGEPVDLWRKRARRVELVKVMQ